MSAAQRIQRKRTKGWRMPDGAVYVGRPTKFGNPFAVGETATLRTKFGDASVPITITPELAVACYRVLVADRGREDFYPLGHGDRTALRWRNAIVHLAGHDLACWCPLNQPCHADVLLELANGVPS